MISVSDKICLDTNEVAAFQLRGLTLFIILKSGAIINEEFSCEMLADEAFDGIKYKLKEEQKL